MAQNLKMAKGKARRIVTTKFLVTALTVTSLGTVAGCHSPEPGPDKTLGGAVLGAGWGAGAGAIVGNQVDATGQGVAIGAGLGLVHGALVGAQADAIEDGQIAQERELQSLKVQSVANARELADIQLALDRSAAGSGSGGVYQVYFDSDETSLKTGATANLEVIAESIKADTGAAKIHVVGHTDDSGNTEYNSRLAEARARSVSAYLAARGISVDQIEVESFGAKRPIASNNTESGRQLNRRVDVYTSK